MYFSEQTGFSIDQLPLSSSTESVKQITHQVGDVTRSNYGWGARNQTDAKLKKLINMAYAAYNTDGLVKNVVDKFSEMFKDFSFEGNPKAVEYIENRFNLMGIQMGEYWKTFISRGINEYFKTGNWMFLKFRGYNEVSQRRGYYTNSPYALSGVTLISANRVDTHYDSNRVFDGWQIKDWISKDPIALVNRGALKLSGTRVTVLPKPSEKYLLTPGVDLGHIAYKKGADSYFGNGMILQGLEDVSLLRSLELTLAVMLKKFSAPLIHHEVPSPSLLQGPQNNIKDAYLLHQKMAPDGVIITGPGHKLTAIGAESQAIRGEGYLKYYSGRACAGLSGSPYLLGLESGSMGAQEAATEDMLKKVRWCQKDIADQFKFNLLDELLWEGGFDPDNPEQSVRLVFDDVDHEMTMKRESHAVDMWTKQGISNNQLQERLNFKEPLDESRLYLNMIDKPKADHEATVKGQAQKDAGVAIAKARPKPNSTAKKPSKSRAREQILKLYPRHVGDLEDFTLLMSKRLEISKETFEPILSSLEALISDEEAFIELVLQTVADV